MVDAPPFGPGMLEADASVAPAGQPDKSVEDTELGIVRPKVSIHADPVGVIRFPLESSVRSATPVIPEMKSLRIPLRSMVIPRRLLLEGILRMPVPSIVSIVEPVTLPR